MHVAIIGGGIGGLTLALSLDAAHIDCRVYEAATRLRPLGVGITMLPHAVKELQALGLLPGLLAGGVETNEIIYASREGEVVWREPRGRAAGYRWPEISIQRATLQSLLLEQVDDRIGQGTVLTSHRVVRVQPREPRVDMGFAPLPDGTVPPPASADLVVGADGIRSRIRELLHPDEGPLHTPGITLWRGVSRTERPIGSGMASVVMGNARAKFSCAPIGQLDDGGQLVNWTAALRAPVQSPEAEWNRHAGATAFLDAFQDWSKRLVDIPALVQASDEVFEYPLCDRDPLPFWHRGPVTLIGDAAHPMYPHGANGSAQAVLDARRLALELSRRTSIEAALRVYENARRPATAELLAMHRAGGPDSILDLYETRVGDATGPLEQVLPFHEREQIARRYRKLAGFDAQTLNYSPTMTPERRVR
ncbi:MAG: FAD-dependent monooxygenase [Burkholderiaceae bacterium]|nr:FAD-dependent monooxygenase [Burkholderiaceae bacterium]